MDGPIYGIIASSSIYPFNQNIPPKLQVKNHLVKNLLAMQETPV